MPRVGVDGPSDRNDNTQKCSNGDSAKFAVTRPAARTLESYGPVC